MAAQSRQTDETSGNGGHDLFKKDTLWICILGLLHLNFLSPLFLYYLFCGMIWWINMTDSTYNSSVQFLPNFGTNCSFEVALGQNQSVNKIPCIIMCIQFCLDSNHFVYRRRISLMLFSNISQSLCNVPPSAIAWKCKGVFYFKISPK